VTIQGLKGSGSTGISPKTGASRKRGERNLQQGQHKLCAARVLQALGRGNDQGSAHHPPLSPICFFGQGSSLCFILKGLA